MRLVPISIVTLGAALGGSCSDPTSISPTQLNFDRPVDIGFACYGGMRVTGGRPTSEPSDAVITTAQPTTSCDFRSQARATGTEEPRPPGQEGEMSATNWFGFILQSAPGTVVISRWPVKPASQFLVSDVVVLDADRLTPGNNGISVGEEPIAIATDTNGCYEITANAGSCDLSAIEINSVLDFDPNTPPRVDRLQVKNASEVPILARPAAMVAQPSTEVVGNTCPASASGVVYIAYPSCNLVGVVDVATGKMVAGIKLEATGARVTGGNETCPDECVNASGEVDVIPPGIRPVTLSLRTDPRVGSRRLAIGADNSPMVTVVDLDAAYLPVATAPLQVALSNPTGDLGLTSIALSPQIGMGGTAGVANTDDASPGGQGQYAYAVATDGTVRVADVLTAGMHTPRECDTQIDSRFARGSTIEQLQCFPVGGPLTPPRRSGARGPGIELIGNAVPVSVAMFRAPLRDEAEAPAPATLIGYFAIVTASNGGSFVINIDDDNNAMGTDRFVEAQPQVSNPSFVMAHQLRDGVSDRGAVPTGSTEGAAPACGDLGPGSDATGSAAGGPRASQPPGRVTEGGPVATTKVPELPMLRQVHCDGSDTPADGSPISEMMYAAELKTRDEVFPDIRSLRGSETWSLTWEGTLSLDAGTSSSVDGLVVRNGQMRVLDTGMRLLEQTKPFCEMGVEPFDTVQFRGCNSSNGNGDCPAGYTCFVHPQSLIVGFGACMLSDEAERLATACRDFLVTSRRYTVASAKSGELALLPRKRVLRTTPIDGCVSDAQCEELADYALQNASSKDPVAERDATGKSTITDPHTWVCRADELRKPVNLVDPAKNKRCIESCTSTADCDLGTICQSGVCMEGVIPPQACVNGPQRFEVRASDAFAVIGTRSGFVHPIIERADGTCGRDPVAGGASSVQIGRIPLQAPACDPTADPITGKRADGTFEPNPCSLTTPQAENQPDYPNIASGSCTLAEDPVHFARRNAPAIQFRNRGMRLTLVDPYYEGDQTCILDRQGGRDKIPLVFPGYQLTFGQTAGYVPLVLPASVNPAFPVKVVAGPTDSIWIIDDGDFLSTNVGQASTRGKVFRVESIDLGTVNLLE